jgi:hypothetical protein
MKKGGKRVDIQLNNDWIRVRICPYMQSDVGNKRSSEIEVKQIKHKLKQRIIKRTQ